MPMEDVSLEPQTGGPSRGIPNIVVDGLIDSLKDELEAAIYILRITNEGNGLIFWGWYRRGLPGERLKALFSYDEI